MPVFLDFEASSLGKRSYPVEVAWIDEAGVSETYLIRPAPAWTDWDPRAAAIHGISRATLEQEGTPVETVARRMLDTLSGRDLFASAPSWDGKWLSTLLRAAGLPRHALRLRDTEEAQRSAAADILRGAVPDEALGADVQAVLDQVRLAAEGQPVRHRALADAEAERDRWIEVCRLAEARRAQLPAHRR